MTSPVVTHPVCDLDMRWRLRQARMEAVARAVSRAGGRRTLFERLLGRPPASREIPAAEDLSPCGSGEDVWKALRF